MNDFAKAIESAQRLPELPEGGDDALIDPFKGDDPASLVSRVANQYAEGQIPNAAAYELTYHCRRFLMGQITAGFENGAPIFDTVDDSAEFTEIMNKSLTAKAIIFKKESTFLKDGTVVIWVEWGEPNTTAKTKNPKTLTMAELLSPESPERQEDSGEADSF